MLNPKEKCAIFLDIDGTLLADSFIIPQGNLDAIAAARAKGHLVFVNTGRSLGNIPPVLMNQIKDFDGIIAGIGAIIIINGEVKANDSFSPDLVRRVLDYFLLHEEYWALFEGRKNVYDVAIGKNKCQPYAIPIESAEDFNKILENDDEIQVIAMGKTVPDEFKELFKNELTVFQFDTYADLVVKGRNKATGIEKVLDLTGVKRENTIAIGDSNNDYDMLTFAGVGVAMANSQQSILDIADYVTESNFNCGVGKAIENILL